MADVHGDVPKSFANYNSLLYSHQMIPEETLKSGKLDNIQ